MYTRVAKFNTLDRIDLPSLECEIVVRGLRCEVPECSSPAVSMLVGELPALVCKIHRDACNNGMRRQIQGLIASFLRRVVLEAANRAWHGSEDEQVIEYRPTIVSRYIEAPDVVHQPTLKERTAKVRPPIGSLVSHNAAEVVTFELFVA